MSLAATPVLKSHRIKPARTAAISLARISDYSNQIPFAPLALLVMLCLKPPASANKSALPTSILFHK